MFRKASVVTVVALSVIILAMYPQGAGGAKGAASKYTAAKVKNANTGEESPGLVREKSPAEVVNQHLKALNACDWKALLAQYPDQVEIHTPGGSVVRGRQATADLFAKFVLPTKDGGLCGIKFSEESRQIINQTLVVQWVANADFLAEPYRGSDAYVTDDGLMAAMVTTFDGAEMKMKK